MDEINPVRNSKNMPDISKSVNKSKIPDDDAQRRGVISNGIKIGGKYRHFKGKEYRVIGLAQHSETLEDFVVYQKLYDDGALWVRPKSMFLENVERDGYKPACR